MSAWLGGVQRSLSSRSRLYLPELPELEVLVYLIGGTIGGGVRQMGSTLRAIGFYCVVYGVLCDDLQS